MFHTHLDILQIGVHGYVYTHDGSLYNCSILQLNNYRVIDQLHEKPNQLHFILSFLTDVVKTKTRYTIINVIV